MGGRLADQIKLIAARGHRPALIVGLLSMYTEPAEFVPSDGLVRAVEELGLSAPAARTALSRLCSDGSLLRNRVGRRTSYCLDDRARYEADVARDRMIRTPVLEGDRLSLVAFTIPETSRQLRHHLRAELTAAGYIGVFDGVWAAPSDSASVALEIVSSYEEASICAFDAVIDGRGDVPAAVRSPDLARRRAALAEFVAMYEPLCGIDLAPAQAYCVRSGLARDWFALIDPQLQVPKPLMAEWPIEIVRDVTTTLWGATAAPGACRFADLVAASVI